MDMQTLLFRMGIGTWTQDFITTFGAIGQSEIIIGQNLPTDIGYIYGMNTYADGVDAQNNPLPSTVNMQNIWLNLKSGSTTFFETRRMSDLLNEFAGTPVVRPEKFIPVSIPRFDLSKSFYANPTAITNVAVHLTLWYVQADAWKEIKQSFNFKDYKQNG
jgi:hypothetical protein